MLRVAATARHWKTPSMAATERSALAALGRLSLRLRDALRRLGELVHADYWFPHSLFSLALFGLGLHLLLKTVSATLTPLWHGHTVDAHALEHLNLSVVDLARLVIGLSMVVMSIGLQLRSRLAWLLTLVLLATVTLLQLKHDVQYPWWVYSDGMLLVALVLAHRSFSRSSVAAATLYALTATLMLLFYAVFGSYYLGKDFKPAITDLATALYYAVVTMTTVGYGDILPVSVESRMFTISVIVLGITVFATSLGAVIGPAVSNSVQRIVHRREPRMQRSNHFIVIGATALATNTYQELRSRQLPVTLILLEPPPAGELDEDADVILGDASDVAVLRKAGAESARAVLAMRDDDSENAFIILALKELEAKAKSVAAVNDTRNLKRVQRVQPDMIVAPQILGGELLAMALAGEPISEDYVMQRLFNTGA